VDTVLMLSSPVSSGAAEHQPVGPASGGRRKASCGGADFTAVTFSSGGSSGAPAASSSSFSVGAALPQSAAQCGSSTLLRHVAGSGGAGLLAGRTGSLVRVSIGSHAELLAQQPAVPAWGGGVT
jgi:hypothetical protein